jgi:hypothetical protein
LAGPQQRWSRANFTPIAFSSAVLYYSQAAREPPITCYRSSLGTKSFTARDSCNTPS